MRVALLIACLFAAAPAFAQEDDESYLAGFLEDNLSEAGRTITINGFEGALSSRAAIDSLLIADDEGVWITLNGIVLDWSRSSLLSGEVEITELSAEEIIVARLPQAEDSALPDPEAKGFSLPELPVSVNIGKIAADRILLEAPVIGTRIEGSLDAAMSLAGGEGVATLDLLRKDDGPEGRITLDASYSNANRSLQLSLTAVEGAGGIAANLIGLPGAPSVALSVDGQGPFEDFATDIRLTTDDVDRLTGRVNIAAVAGQGTRFAADLKGDLAPLFLPQYAEFFGPAVALRADGARSSSGRLVLDAFALTTRSLSLEGSAALAADGLPEKLRLRGDLVSPDGSPVLLPLAGDVETRVTGARITLDYSGLNDAGWRGAFVLDGLDRPDFKAERLTIDGSGRIGRTAAGRSFGATVRYAATGLLPQDADLATALGRSVQGRLKAHWLEGSGVLSIPELDLTADSFDARISAKIDGLQDAFTTSGRLQINAADLSRFAGLVGRPLEGAGVISLEGSGSRLSGFFDLVGIVEGQGLGIGIDQIDRLLDGQSRATLSVKRDDTGTFLRSMELSAKTLRLTGSGTLSSKGSDLKASLDFTDISALDPGYRGALRFDAGFSGTPEDGTLTLSGTGDGLRIGQAEIDRLLAGQSDLAARLALSDGAIRIETATLANPQLKADVSGRIAGAVRELTVAARLADLALLVPEFPGPLTLSGTAVQDETGFDLDLRGTGPGQVDARVEGRVSNSFAQADLALSGTGQAALANIFLDPRAISGPVGFDLRLNGPIRLSSLSGRISMSGGRLTDPNLGFALERIEAVGNLSSGQVRIAATTQLSTGGRIRLDGPIDLAAPNSAELALQLDRLRLVDPELYETFASGSLTIVGPLAGGALIAGRIDLSDTEIRVPSSGFGSASGLAKLRHAGEPAAVRETRRKAGLLGDGSSERAGDGPAYGLDVLISAPSRVFVRGRGIDAELGGALQLSGTTRNVIPSGGLTLIRGRLDILGKRLVLQSADLTLEGSFVPELLISASNESDGVVSFVTIDGPANDPAVSFSSTPELPQEEVLARLLFGRGLESISALQAAQLASAVAVLAGRSGEGVIGKLRKGFGLDDLDVTTSEDGTAALRAGKYLSENVYTEVEVDQGGQSRINLNLDLRPGVTVKGRVGADGETGIGLFLEKDY